MENTKRNKFRKLIKSKILWIFLIVVVGLIAYWQLKPQPQIEYTTQPVVRQDLKQTVSVTGSVQGAEEIELNFETTGILAELKVGKGDKVKAGDLLARLSASNQQNAVLEARANLQAAQATLQKLLAGASQEDIAVSQESVKQAEVAYNNKVKDLDNLRIKLSADEKSYRDIISNKEIDFANQRDSLLNTINNELFDANAALNRIRDILDKDEAKDTLGAKDISSKVVSENSQILGVSKLETANSALAAAQATLSTADINTAVDSALAALTQVSQALSDMYNVLVNTPAGSSYTQTEIDADRANISSDQTIISSSITSIQTAKNSWDTARAALVSAQNNLNTFLANKEAQLSTAEGAVASAKSSWELAQAQLRLKEAPPRPEDIAMQRARVAQAQASLSRAQATLAQMTIVAPVDGVITRTEYEQGEKTSLTKSVLAILGNSGLEIEVDIPESDIAKVAVGQSASITLDAFGDDRIFQGHVTFIDPAETVIQDVVYYKVKVTFDSQEEDIKPGMTANIDIITAQKQQTLAVPIRAVKSNGAKYVEILSVEGKPVKKEIVTGLRADGGLVEVLDGLEEGDEVVTFIKQPK